MKRSVPILLATFVAVFFFALSLTLTIAQQANADQCCNPCPPSCEPGLGRRDIQGICQDTPTDPGCNIGCNCW